MAGNKLIFKNAEEARDAIMASQKKRLPSSMKIGQMRLVRELNTTLTNPLRVLQCLSDITENCRSN